MAISQSPHSIPRRKPKPTHTASLRLKLPATNPVPSKEASPAMAQYKNGVAQYYNSDDAAAGEILPLVSQVFGNKTTSVPGAFAERLRRGLPVLGLSVASLAVTRLAAGEPTTSAAGFGLFLMLIAGLSAVNIHALRD